MRTKKLNIVEDLDRLDTLLVEFKQVVDIGDFGFEDDLEYDRLCKEASRYLQQCQRHTAEEHLTAFWAQVNAKFRINSNHLGQFFEKAANLGVSFNYHKKSAIQALFDRNELHNIAPLLRTFGVKDADICALVSDARAADFLESKHVLQMELNDPTQLRKAEAGRNIKSEILKGLFASFIWSSVSNRDMHRFFDVDFDEKKYNESFWDELQRRSPRLFHRDQAAHVLFVSNRWAARFETLNELRDSLLTKIQQSYEQLNNHGILAVHIENIHFDGRNVSWELCADLMLYGEKHLERPIDRGYFRYKQIKNTTENHIPELTAAAKFSLGNEGFTYRDCFVLQNQNLTCDQLLIFQKNERDETVVPCPSCRSDKVEGNSYPSLGVKSWECVNPLCPERSKYNRGKRYSFRALTMQQALDDEHNEIPADFVKKWRRDVVVNIGINDVLELVVRHYSMCGDQLSIYGGSGEFPKEYLGRSINLFDMTEASKGATSWFESAAFFSRYIVDSTAKINRSAYENSGDEKLQVYHGDSREVLTNFPEESIDGAVTSPPYYNAREYSQWPNIYCYLRDMYLVNKQMYRVLKPGAIYFYNIFDYFDNENITALSAMGKKRIVLSAYTVDLFRRIGFRNIGNIIWDKGEIEGKRGFNGGNYSPFYQSPFNCWEHVLIFQKPGPSNTSIPTSRLLNAKPVLKMVNGENTHGHSAPFPDEIPMLCMATVEPGGTILDPFGGSLTTGRVAVRQGRRAICVEASLEYCQLGLKLYRDETNHHG